MIAGEFFESSEFQYFLDKMLRTGAKQAVENLLKNFSERKLRPVKKSQVRTIINVVQGGGLSALKKLIKKQKEKIKGDNYKSEKDLFWEFIESIIVTEPGAGDSLRLLLNTELEKQGLLQDENAIEDKILKKQARKSNRIILENVMDRALPVYFEHFSSHFFYQTALNPKQ